MNENTIKVYIKRDEKDSIVEIKSSIFIDDYTGFEEIDEWKEGEERYLYAHADNGEYVQQKYGKPLYDELGRPNFYGQFSIYTDEEKQKLYPIEEPISEIEELRQRQEILAQALQDVILMNLSVKGDE